MIVASFPRELPEPHDLRFVSAAGLVPCRVLLTYLLSELWLTFEGTHCLLLDLSHKMRQTQVVKLRNIAAQRTRLAVACQVIFIVAYCYSEYAKDIWLQ